MAEKVTTMVLKVDLQCHCCYKKTKNVLSKFPQIRDQVYDDKANTVTIAVVCCSPEKIRDKLCYKGGKVINSIEIREALKTVETKPPKEKTKEAPAENPERGRPPVYVNGVPYYQLGHAFPQPHEPCCEGYYGHGQGYGDGYYGNGYGRVVHAHANRSDSYFTEENPQTCFIM